MKTLTCASSTVGSTPRIDIQFGYLSRSSSDTCVVQRYRFDSSRTRSSIVATSVHGSEASAIPVGSETVITAFASARRSRMICRSLEDAAVLAVRTAFHVTLATSSACSPINARSQSDMKVASLVSERTDQWMFGRVNEVVESQQGDTRKERCGVRRIVRAVREPLAQPWEAVLVQRRK